MKEFVTLTDNLHSIVEQIVANSPAAYGQKAKDLAEEILAQGEDWMKEYRRELELGAHADELETSCPVRDNRNFFVKRWTLTLLDHSN